MPKRKDPPEEEIPLDDIYLNFINDDDFVSMSDGELVLAGKRVPFISSMLSYRSRTLRTMLSSTNETGWVAGVQAAFDPFDPESSRLFLALIHDCDIQRASLHWEFEKDLLGVLPIAEMLEVSAVIREVTSYLDKHPELMDTPNALKWFTILDRLQFGDLKEICMQQILKNCYNSRSGSSTLGHYALEDWSSLNPEQLLQFMTALNNFAYGVQSRAKRSVLQLEGLIASYANLTGWAKTQVDKVFGDLKKVLSKGQLSSDFAKDASINGGPVLHRVVVPHHIYPGMDIPWDDPFEVEGSPINSESEIISSSSGDSGSESEDDSEAGNDSDE